MHQRQTSRQPAAGRSRSGALTVEFALMFPVLLVTVFGSIEFARLNMLVNSMENAAYEGARRGIVPGATAANATSDARAILDAVGAVNATITITPKVITNQTPQVTVTIRVPLDDNAWVTPQFTDGQVLERSCKLQREVTAF
jgi:Flp pilus assembly protein TadG